MKLVTTLIANTNDSAKTGGDPFWEKSETLLYMALIGYKQLQERIAEVNRKCAELRGEPGMPTSEEYREARRMYRELVIAREIVDGFMGEKTK